MRRFKIWPRIVELGRVDKSAMVTMATLDPASTCAISFINAFQECFSEDPQKDTRVPLSIFRHMVDDILDGRDKGLVSQRVLAYITRKLSVPIFLFATKPHPEEVDGLCISHNVPVGINPTVLFGQHIKDSCWIVVQNNALAGYVAVASHEKVNPDL